MTKLKKDFPKKVNFRDLARQKIIPRCTSYNMRKKGAKIEKVTAERICDIYKLDFNEFFEIVQNEQPYSIETVKGHRRILRALFNEALRYEWITSNPVCKTKVGAGSSNTTFRPVTEKEVFSIKETQDFLAHLNALPDELIIRKIPLKFMLLTGVRIGEMCGLRWSDIDFEKKVVYIRRNRQYQNRVGNYEKEPKTRTSIREIPLTDALIADLRHYMNWFREFDGEFDNCLEEYYLAVNLYREPISTQRIGVWLRNYLRQWKMKALTCHGLRHTYCSLLLSQNVPIQTVSKYMGHSDSTVTVNNQYGHTKSKLELKQPFQCKVRAEKPIRTLGFY